MMGHAQERIGLEEAHLKAEGFVAARTSEGVRVSLNDVVESSTSHLPNLYIFDLEPQGFVMVSATGQLMAYSFESTFPKKDEVPAPIAYWTELYSDITDYYLVHPEEIPQGEPFAAKEAVGPLLTCRWNQGCYYNTDCPSYTSGPCGHVMAGCVALAMAQIMHYHRQPESGNGSLQYNLSYGQLSADFGNTRYRWEDMEDHLYDENPAVAQLIYHCSLAAHTNYSPSVSTTTNDYALKAFLNYFKYPMAALLRRENVSDEMWFSIMKDDLDKRLPVYFAGRSSQGGHAFVCDGYDEDGFFHFNFGWGGEGNGFFTLQSPMGFSSTQSIIHDLVPFNNIDVKCDAHGIYYVSTNGTGDGSSWANATSNLLGAIVKCQAPRQSVWVKEGVYYGSEADYAIRIPSPCKIYGSFKGDEPFDYDLSLRDFLHHPTVIDGNHLRGVISQEMLIPDNTKTVIDGFILQNGVSEKGAGLLLTNAASIRNCIIQHNQAHSAGGGAYCVPVQNTDYISFEKCEFLDNDAPTGAGLYAGNNNSFITCIFSNNQAGLKGGGAYTRQRSSNKFWSCLFNNNTAKLGGGVFVDGNTALYNCTVAMNEARENYGGVYGEFQSDPDYGILKNCIVWGNSAPGNYPQLGPSYFSYSCAIQDYPSPSVQLAPDNDGNESKPYVRFLKTADQAGVAGHGGDWRLASNSVCINRADTIKGQPKLDLAGHPRLQQRKIDLGAYETNTASSYIEGYICEQDPFVYQGVTYQETGTYTFLYPNPDHDSLVILYVQADEYQYSHRIREICDNEYYNFLGQQLNQPGHYSEMVGCTLYELDLSVYPMPHLEVIGDTLVSIGQAATLSAFGAKKYHWSMGDTTATVMFYPTQDQLVTVVGTNNGICSDSIAIQVKVKNTFVDPIVYVYPNPASNTTKVFASNILKVEVFDIYGFRLDVQWSEYEPVELDVSRYPAGVYYLYVQSLNKRKTAKLIVTH